MPRNCWHWTRIGTRKVLPRLCCCPFCTFSCHRFLLCASHTYCVTVHREKLLLNGDCTQSTAQNCQISIDSTNYSEVEIGKHALQQCRTQPQGHSHGPWTNGQNNFDHTPINSVAVSPGPHCTAIKSRLFGEKVSYSSNATHLPWLASSFIMCAVSMICTSSASMQHSSADNLLTVDPVSSGESEARQDFHTFSFSSKLSVKHTMMSCR